LALPVPLPGTRCYETQMTACAAAVLPRHASIWRCTSLVASDWIHRGDLIAARYAEARSRAAEILILRRRFRIRAVHRDHGLIHVGAACRMQAAGDLRERIALSDAIRTIAGRRGGLGGGARLAARRRACCRAGGALKRGWRSAGAGWNGSSRAWARWSHPAPGSRPPVPVLFARSRSLPAPWWRRLRGRPSWRARRVCTPAGQATRVLAHQASARPSHLDQNVTKGSGIDSVRPHQQYVAAILALAYFERQRRQERRLSMP